MARAPPDQMGGLLPSRRGVPAVLAEPLGPLRGAVPPLANPARINAAAYRGPTEESNWVLYGRLLVGAYPGAVDDIQNDQTLRSILQLGITTFVCLQSEYQHRGVTREDVLAGRKLRPYIYDAVRLLPDVSWPAPEVCCAPKPKEGLHFVHFPIVDCSTANDTRVLELAHDLVGRLAGGENLYVHCWGGHGRTGTVVSIMLGLMYGLRAADCMAFLQYVHDLRVCPMDVGTPQTAQQRQQVTRILEAVSRAAAAERARAQPHRLQQQSHQEQQDQVPLTARAVTGPASASTSRTQTGGAIARHQRSATAHSRALSSSSSSSSSSGGGGFSAPASPAVSRRAQTKPRQRRTQREQDVESGYGVSSSSSSSSDAVSNRRAVSVMTRRTTGRGARQEAERAAELHAVPAALPHVRGAVLPGSVAATATFEPGTAARGTQRGRNATTAVLDDDGGGSAATTGTAWSAAAGPLSVGTELADADSAFTGSSSSSSSTPRTTPVSSRSSSRQDARASTSASASDEPAESSKPHPIRPLKPPVPALSLTGVKTSQPSADSHPAATEAAATKPAASDQEDEVAPARKRTLSVTRPLAPPVAVASQPSADDPIETDVKVTDTPQSGSRTRPLGLTVPATGGVPLAVAAGSVAARAQTRRSIVNRAHPHRRLRRAVTDASPDAPKQEDAPSSRRVSATPSSPLSGVGGARSQSPDDAETVPAPAHSSRGHTTGQDPDDATPSFPPAAPPAAPPATRNDAAQQPSLTATAAPQTKQEQPSAPVDSSPRTQATTSLPASPAEASPVTSSGSAPTNGNGHLRSSSVATNEPASSSSSAVAAAVPASVAPLLPNPRLPTAPMQAQAPTRRPAAARITAAGPRASRSNRRSPLTSSPRRIVASRAAAPHRARHKANQEPHAPSQQAAAPGPARSASTSSPPSDPPPTVADSQRPSWSVPSMATKTAQPAAAVAMPKQPLPTTQVRTGVTTNQSRRQPLATWSGPGDDQADADAEAAANARGRSTAPVATSPRSATSSKPSPPSSSSSSSSGVIVARRPPQQGETGSGPRLGSSAAGFAGLKRATSGRRRRHRPSRKASKGEASPRTDEPASATSSAAASSSVPHSTSAGSTAVPGGYGRRAHERHQLKRQHKRATRPGRRVTKRIERRHAQRLEARAASADSKSTTATHE